MEYTNNNNIEIVVRLLKENNISDIVISPGGQIYRSLKNYKMMSSLIVFLLLMKEVPHTLLLVFIYKDINQ